GSGVLALRHEIVFVYAQAKPTSQAPAVSPDSIASSSDASCVCLPISRAAIWSIETPASRKVSLVGGDTSVRNRVLAFAWAPPGRPGVGTQANPLTTRSWSRYGASALNVGVSSNAAPSLIGVQF